MHRALPHALRTVLLCLPFALTACDDEAGAGASTPGEAGHGLVVVPADPALAGLSPEELEASGARPYFHDFGSVPLGEVVQHVFPLRNTDPTPLTVTRMQASCGCTRPVLRLAGPDGPVTATAGGRSGAVLTIPPGAEAELLFRIETAHSEPISHNLDKLYTVQMQTDSPHRAYLRFEAHIVIERAFQANPHPLDLGRVSRSGGGRGTVDVVPVGGVRARVVGVGELPPGVEARVVAEPYGGAEVWTLEVDLLPPLDPGPILHRFDLLTEDAEGFPYYPFPVEVRAFATADVDWTPQRFVLRNADRAEPLEATIDLYPLLPGERLAATAARLEGEGTERLELALSAHGRDSRGRSERWTLTLRTRPPFGDAQVRGKAVVEIDGHEDAEIEVLVHPR